MLWVGHQLPINGPLAFGPRRLDADRGTRSPTEHPQVHGPGQVPFLAVHDTIAFGIEIDLVDPLEQGAWFAAQDP